MRAAPRLCEFYPGICLTKAWKNLSQGKKNSVTVQYAYYQKHPHITKPSQTHTLQNPHTHTNTLQNNIKPPQYKLKYERLMHLVCWFIWTLFSSHRRKGLMERWIARYVILNMMTCPRTLSLSLLSYGIIYVDIISTCCWKYCVQFSYSPWNLC